MRIFDFLCCNLVNTVFGVFVLNQERLQMQSDRHKTLVFVSLLQQ